MMKKLIKSFSFLFLITSFSSLNVSALNLIVNGDFTAGNTGFTSSYSNMPFGNPFGTYSSYGIVANPNVWYPNFAACPDHTTGTGRMMVVDGSNVTNTKLWEQTLTVVPGKTYLLSYYLQSLSAAFPAKIEIFINGISLGSPITAPATTCSWVQKSYSWNAGVFNSAVITIYDRETAGIGNDFAIDDLSFTAVPSSLAVTSPVYLCQNSPAVPLEATPSSGGTLNWYGTNANGGTASATAPVPSTASVGSTTYYVSETVGGTESSRVQIVVNVVADNGATIVNFRCDPSQATTATSVYFDWGNNLLTFNPIYNYTYTVAGGGTFSGQRTWGDTNLEVFGLMPGQSVSLTITSLVQYPCVPPQTVTCSVPCGAVSIIPTFSTIPTTYCINEVPPILPLTSADSPTIEGTWSPSAINTSTAGKYDYIFTPDPVRFPCASKKTLRITVELVEPIFTDFSVCSGKPVPNLSPVSPNGITGTWSPPNIDNTTSASYVFTPDLGQACAPTVKTINITVNPSVIIINLDWTVTAAFSNRQIVTVTDPVGIDYLYQLDDGPFQVSTVFENVSSGNHSITVKDVNGCSEFRNGNVLVIDYPKFFTPNNDGHNDTWNIFSLQDQPSSRILIFDRYGKLLKQIFPDGSGWDGTYIGQPMPATDYWFSVEYTEQAIPKKFNAHFSLKR